MVNHTYQKEAMVQQENFMWNTNRTMSCITKRTYFPYVVVFQKLNYLPSIFIPKNVQLGEMKAYMQLSPKNCNITNTALLT